MIKSFKDKETRKVFNQVISRKLPGDIQARALRKLMMLNSAESEFDLLIPRSNEYEHLKGDRKGECSRRINSQWRICFRFQNGNAYDVIIEDYH
jgi:toxin HigB-1